MTTSTTPARARASSNGKAVHPAPRKRRVAASAKSAKTSAAEKKAAPVPKQVKAKWAALQTRWKTVLAAAEDLKRNGATPKTAKPRAASATKSARAHRRSRPA